MRKAKIVATLGPASNSIEMLVKLINAGMNVARVNMSHGTHDDHAQTIKNVREASKVTGYEVAILLDLQGPKIRVDKLKENLILSVGEIWSLGATKFSFGDKYIPTIYEALVTDAKVGARILFDDGLLEALVIAKKENFLEIEIKAGGELKSNKGINLPDIKVSAPSFTDKDREDLFFGLKNNIDYVALSFVRTKEDVLEVKYLLHKLKKDIPIISKIEKPEAIKNIESIIEVTDVIMIARGDMGVEVGNHLVPAVQKKIITLCNDSGTPVITATQMLESMISNGRPTRAEASDVANAVWDGTDAVMLSAETASGKFPIEAVKMMDSIICEAEKSPKERPLLRNMDLGSISLSLQVASSLVAEKINARWIISLTESGDSCLKITRFRPRIRVLGVSNSVNVLRRMCLYWGITPYNLSSVNEENVLVLENLVLEKMGEQNLLDHGDKVVITRGDGKYFKDKTSNSIRVEIIKNKIKTDKFHIDQDHIDESNFDSGKILLDTEACVSCDKCLDLCPHDIWEVTKDEHRDTKINDANSSTCSFDMQCVDICPAGAIEIIPKA